MAGTVSIRIREAFVNRSADNYDNCNAPVNASVMFTTVIIVTRDGPVVVDVGSTGSTLRPRSIIIYWNLNATLVFEKRSDRLQSSSMITRVYESSSGDSCKNYIKKSCPIKARRGGVPRRRFTFCILRFSTEWGGRKQTTTTYSSVAFSFSTL